MCWNNAASRPDANTLGEITFSGPEAAENQEKEQEDIWKIRGQTLHKSAVLRHSIPAGQRAADAPLPRRITVKRSDMQPFSSCSRPVMMSDP